MNSSIKSYIGDIFLVDCDWICVPVNYYGYTDSIFRERFPGGFEVCVEFCQHGFMKSGEILTVHRDKDSKTNKKRNIIYFPIAEKTEVSEDIIIASFKRIIELHTERDIKSIVFPCMTYPKNFNQLIDNIFSGVSDIVVYKNVTQENNEEKV